MRSIDEAIDQFCRAAIKKGNCARPPSKDHAFYERMEEAWRFLEKHGAAGREAFKALLSHRSRYVRGWVAAQLLAIGDQAGIFVLEADARTEDLQGFSSEMMSREWRAGRLQALFNS